MIQNQANFGRSINTLQKVFVRDFIGTFLLFLLQVFYRKFYEFLKSECGIIALVGEKKERNTKSYS
jgi:hypothetical protein